MAGQWPPRKNAAFTARFPIYGGTTLPVSGVAGFDSEISKDGGAFADCTNEAVELGTSGIYALVLTAAEMNADLVVVRVKTTVMGTTVIVIDTLDYQVGSTVPGFPGDIVVALT